MKLSNEKKDLWCLFLVSFLSFFPNLWVDRAGLMEARNFITAREMIKEGNWIITTLNGNYRFEKPPLPTWITAIFMKLFETTGNEYVLRLPIAILSAGLIYLIYFFVKTATKNHRLAFISSLVSATTFMLIKLGNDNTWDMFAYILMFGCTFFVFKGLKENRIKDFILSGIFLGLSLLSKGPVPFYGMLLPFIGAYMLVYGTTDLKREWKKLVVALIIGVTLALAWPLAAFMYQRKIFLSVMVKEVNTWGTKHIGSYFYYLDYVIYMGVWLIFVVMSFHKRWSEKKSENKKFFSFLFFWNIITLILISLIKMKKKRYGVPLYIITPMMISHLINYYLNQEWFGILKKERYMLKLHFFLLIIISLGIPIVFYIMGYRKDIIGSNYLVGVTLIFSLFLFNFIEIFRTRKSIKRGIFLTGLFMICVNILTVYFFERALPESDKDKYSYLSSLRGKLDYEKSVYTIESDGVMNVWNIGTKIIKITDLNKLPSQFLLLEEMKEQKLKEYLGSNYIIEEKKTYYKYEDEEKLIYLYKVKRSE